MFTKIATSGIQFSPGRGFKMGLARQLAATISRQERAQIRQNTEVKVE